MSLRKRPTEPSEASLRLSDSDEFNYCMATSPDGHHCALPLGHSEVFHYGGSPLLDEVDWVMWPACGGE
jgi:hypothetical protein